MGRDHEKYKVAQLCREELERLRQTDTSTEKKAEVRQRQAYAVAAAVEALSKLHHFEVQKNLKDF